MSTINVINFILQRKRFFETKLALDTADMPKKLIPELKFDNSDKIYTIPGLILIGMKRIMSKIEEDIIQEIFYYIGHEEQHIRSTTDKAWMFGLKRGQETIIEYLSETMEPVPRRFIKDSDYDNFIRGFLAQNGYHLVVSRLQEIVHFIMNSLEDGRIERIRSTKNKLFRSRVIKFRGIIWKKDECPEPSENPDVAEKLVVIMNQILSLSTTSLYQKGFTKYYLDTDVEEKIKEIMPHIARGVASKNCRGCMIEAIEICRILASEISEVCRLSEEDKKLMDLIRSILENLSKYSANENNEETSDEIGEALFGHSDLVLELDDEEFDKLKANSVENDEDEQEDGLRVIIKRKNPKPEKESEEESVGESDASDGNSDEKKEESSEGSEDDDSKEKSEESKTVDTGKKLEDKESDENSENSNGGSDDESEEEESDKDKEVSSGSDDKSDDKSDDSNGSGDKSDDESDEDDKPNQYTKLGPGSGKGEGEFVGDESDDEDDGISEDEITDIIEKAIAENEEKSKKISETIAEGINTSLEEESKKVFRPSKEDNSGLPNLSTLKSSYKYNVKFEEILRNYPIDEIMDVSLEMQCETVKRKAEESFKNKVEPNITCKTSGEINELDLYKMAISEFDFFMKKGEADSFDGCAELACDNSGSMGNGRYSSRYYASRGLAIVEEAFKDLMPLKIIAFDSDDTDHVRHRVIKNWEEVHQNSCSWNFYKHASSGSGNKDGYSIRVATRELLARPEKKKILGVLSDGLPSCYDHNEGMSDVRKAVEEARNNGIEVFSIYFTDSMDAENVITDSTAQKFREMYGGNAICCNTEDLPERLIEAFNCFVM